MFDDIASGAAFTSPWTRRTAGHVAGTGTG
jgi:hypothetical protein